MFQPLKQNAYYKLVIESVHSSEIERFRQEFMTVMTFASEWESLPASADPIGQIEAALSLLRTGVVKWRHGILVTLDL